MLPMVQTMRIISVNDNFSKAFFVNLSAQILEIVHISENGHLNSSNLVLHDHYLAILMGKATKVDDEEATVLLNTTFAGT